MDFEQWKLRREIEERIGSYEQIKSATKISLILFALTGIILLAASLVAFYMRE